MNLSVACLAASVLLAAAPSMAQVVAPPDPDPADPPEAPDPVPVWAMFDKFTAKHHEKWEIRATDVLVIVEAVAAHPTQGDILSISGEDYAILAVAAEGPGFPAVMYECQLRR